MLCSNNVDNSLEAIKPYDYIFLVFVIVFVFDQS